MEPSRILLLVAVGVFVAFLVVKMQPRFDDDEPEGEPLEPLTRAEKRLYRRLRKLPPESLARLAARIDRLLERAADGEIPDAADSLAGDSIAGDSLAGDDEPPPSDG